MTLLSALTTMSAKSWLCSVCVSELCLKYGRQLDVGGLDKRNHPVNQVLGVMESVTFVSVDEWITSCFVGLFFLRYRMWGTDLLGCKTR